MSAISLQLPESLHKQARELAAQEGISVNQLVTTALAEKMAALMTEGYLEQRAKRGDRAKFERALEKIADTPPEPQDCL